MTQEAYQPGAEGTSGFWRLRHDELAALISRDDLPAVLLRVYLAVADQTRGFQKAEDVLSLGQLSRILGDMPRPHVRRALRQLEAKGLYSQSETKCGMVRRVVWPPPVPADGNTPKGVPAHGNSGVATQENTSVTTGGNKGVATGGTLQEGKKFKKKKEPPTPPADGGRRASSVSPTQNRKSRIRNAEEAIAHVEAAYRAAGRPALSAADRRKVIKEFHHGAGAELVGMIDAAAVRGAVKATPANRTFGWGWLVIHLQGVIATAQAASAQREEAMAAAQEDRKRKEMEDARRQLESRQRREYFASLPETKQAEYRRQAGEGRFH